jgi:hypothetical protein
VTADGISVGGFAPDDKRSNLIELNLEWSRTLAGFRWRDVSDGIRRSLSRAEVTHAGFNIVGNAGRRIRESSSARQHRKGQKNDQTAHSVANDSLRDAMRRER